MSQLKDVFADHAITWIVGLFFTAMTYLVNNAVKSIIKTQKLKQSAIQAESLEQTQIKEGLVTLLRFRIGRIYDAVKKGGLMASSSVGGLSGAFIPVSEDLGMIEAVQRGSLCLEKLEAMTCVCSVGLDMIAVPGDTSASTLSAILADEAAIGMINNKTTATRLIPVPGKKPGDMVQFGGLMGYAPVMGISKFKADEFVARGGKIPAPLRSLTN